MREHEFGLIITGVHVWGCFSVADGLELSLSNPLMNTVQINPPSSRSSTEEET